MEVKGRLISATDALACPHRKCRQQMTELLERRRSLQALLATRLAELRRICLKEAELTGAVPSNFPLKEGEQPPHVQRRGGASRRATRKCRVEQQEDDAHRAKAKKTLFSSALRKHSEADSSAHTQTHTHHGKRTVHRGCHTDDMIRSESSSVSESTGHHNGEVGPRRRLLLGPAGSAPEPPPQNRSRTRTEQAEALQNQKPLPLPPPRSQDSSPSSTDLGGGRAPCRGPGSDGVLDRVAVPEEEGGWVTRGTNARWGDNGAGAGGRGRGRGGGHSQVLLDHVWGRRLPKAGAPPTYRAKPGQAPPPCQAPPPDGPRPLQPDPHPHLLPPRPLPLPAHQDSQLEEATRSLHKALALEGLRDWYLRNTAGSTQQNPAGGRPAAGAKGPVGALQRRRTTHGGVQPSAYQTEALLHHAAPLQKQKLPHSATFHGHPLLGRSMDGSFCHDSSPSQKQEVPLGDVLLDQPSPGTLV